MKHGTMKTLGVTALGAAFAAAGAGAASAAPLTGEVERASGQVLSAPPVQDATGGDSIGKMPTGAEDVVSPDTPARAGETGETATQPGGLLGGLPVAGQVTGNNLPTDALTGGGLPTDQLLGGGLPTDQLLGGGLPTDALLGGLPLVGGGGLPVG